MIYRGETKNQSFFDDKRQLTTAIREEKKMSKTKITSTKISYRTIISNKTLGEFVKEKEDKKESALGLF